jgi:hypothetical protein
MALSTDERNTLRMKSAALMQAGNFEDAIAALHVLLSERPTPELMSRIADALVEAGRLDDALEQALDAVQADPLSWVGHVALGRVLAVIGDFAGATQSFHTGAATRRRMPVQEGRVVLPAPFLLHTLEQLDYIERAYPETYAQFPCFPYVERETLEARLKEMIAAAAPAPAFAALSGANKPLLLNLPLVVPDESVPQTVLHPITDFRAIERNFHPHRRGFEVIDGLLSDEALSALRRFCLGATVWGQPYRFGYCGAFPEHGFAGGLLFAIAEAIKTAVPVLLGGYRLVQWWAFVYDSALPSADIHAHASDISVSLWITPDEANVNRERGGIAMWDKTPPAGWTFNDYNGGGDSVADRLNEAGASPTVIAHRANRAVLFQGKPFHRSDGARFVPDFESRRRNITFLFRRSTGPAGRAIQ